MSSDVRRKLGASHVIGGDLVIWNGVKEEGELEDDKKFHGLGVVRHRAGFGEIRFRVRGEQEELSRSQNQLELLGQEGTILTKAKQDYGSEGFYEYCTDDLSLLSFTNYEEAIPAILQDRADMGYMATKLGINHAVVLEGPPFPRMTHKELILMSGIKSVPESLPDLPTAVKERAASITKKTKLWRKMFDYMFRERRNHVMFLMGDIADPQHEVRHMMPVMWEVFEDPVLTPLEQNAHRYFVKQLSRMILIGSTAVASPYVLDRACIPLVGWEYTFGVVDESALFLGPTNFQPSIRSITLEPYTAFSWGWWQGLDLWKSHSPERLQVASLYRTWVTTIRVGTQQMFTNRFPRDFETSTSLIPNVTPDQILAFIRPLEKLANMASNLLKTLPYSTLLEAEASLKQNEATSAQLLGFQQVINKQTHVRAYLPAPLLTCALTHVRSHLRALSLTCALTYVRSHLRANLLTCVPTHVCSSSRAFLFTCALLTWALMHIANDQVLLQFMEAFQFFEAAPEEQTFILSMSFVVVLLDLLGEMMKEEPDMLHEDVREILTEAFRCLDLTTSPESFADCLRRYPEMVPALMELFSRIVIAAIAQLMNRALTDIPALEHRLLTEHIRKSRKRRVPRSNNVDWQALQILVSKGYPYSTLLMQPAARREVRSIRIITMPSHTEESTQFKPANLRAIAATYVEGCFQQLIYSRIKRDITFCRTESLLLDDWRDNVNLHEFFVRLVQNNFKDVVSHIAEEYYDQTIPANRGVPHDVSVLQKQIKDASAKFTDVFVATMIGASIESRNSTRSFMRILRSHAQHRENSIEKHRQLQNLRAARFGSFSAHSDGTHKLTSPRRTRVRINSDDDEDLATVKSLLIATAGHYPFMLMVPDDLIHEILMFAPAIPRVETARPAKEPSSPTKGGAPKKIPFTRSSPVPDSSASSSSESDSSSDIGNRRSPAVKMLSRKPPPPDRQLSLLNVRPQNTGGKSSPVPVRRASSGLQTSPRSPGGSSLRPSRRAAGSPTTPRQSGANQRASIPALVKQRDTQTFGTQHTLSFEKKQRERETGSRETRGFTSMAQHRSSPPRPKNAAMAGDTGTAGGDTSARGDTPATGGNASATGGGTPTVVGDGTKAGTEIQPDCLLSAVVNGLKVGLVRTAFRRRQILRGYEKLCDAAIGSLDLSLEGSGELSFDPSALVSFQPPHPFLQALTEIDQKVQSLVDDLQDSTSCHLSTITGIYRYPPPIKKEFVRKCDAYNVNMLARWSQKCFISRITYSSFLRLFGPSRDEVGGTNYKDVDILALTHPDAGDRRDENSLPDLTSKSEVVHLIKNVLKIPPSEIYPGRTCLFMQRRTWLTLLRQRPLLPRKVNEETMLTLQRGLKMLIARRRYKIALAHVRLFQAVVRKRQQTKRLKLNAGVFLPILYGLLTVSGLLSKYSSAISGTHEHKSETKNQKYGSIQWKVAAEQAAITLQSWIRSVYAQRLLRRRQEDIVRLEAAEFIQRFVRSSIARLILVARAQTKVESVQASLAADMSEEVLLKAVVTIQRIWRQKRSRRVADFKTLRTGLAMMIVPIKRLSKRCSMFSAVMARAHLKAQSRRSSEMAIILDAQKGDPERDLRTGASIIIQSAWRGYTARRQWQNLHQSAWVLQTLLKTQLARRRFLHTKLCVSKIQAWWRAVLLLRGTIPATLTSPRTGRSKAVSFGCVAYPKSQMPSCDSEYVLSINRMLLFMGHGTMGRRRRRKIVPRAQIETQRAVETRVSQVANNLQSGFSRIKYAANQLRPVEDLLADDTRLRRVSAIVEYHEFNSLRGTYKDGWACALFVFLRRYLISALRRYIGKSPKMTEQRRQTLWARSSVFSMIPPLSGKIFTWQDMQDICQPFGNLLLAKSRLSQGIDIGRNRFEIRSLSVGTSCSFVVTSESLLSFLGYGVQDPANIPDSHALQRTMHGQVSCVFGWGLNHDFQLTFEGPAVPFRTSPTTAQTVSDGYGLFPSSASSDSSGEEIDLKAVSPHQSRRPSVKDSRNPNAKKLFDRTAGLHLIRFRHQFSKDAFLEYKRFVTSKDAVKKEQLFSQSISKLLLRSARGGRRWTARSSSDEESVSERLFDSKKRYHPKIEDVIRNVDFTFKIQQVQAGEDFAVALTHEGFLFSWGNNIDGRCGVGRKYGIVPQPMKIPLVNSNNRRVLQYSVGLRHCLAITEGNRVYAWGSHPFIHLVTEPPRSDIFLPTLVPLWSVLRATEPSTLDLLMLREVSRKEEEESGWEYFSYKWEWKTESEEPPTFDHEHHLNDALPADNSSESDAAELGENLEDELASLPRDMRDEERRKRSEWLVDHQDRVAHATNEVPQDTFLERFPRDRGPDEPQGVWKFSWRGMTRRERMWCERIRLLRSERWIVHKVVCGTGANLVHLKSRSQDVKDVMITWGRSDHGRLGVASAAKSDTRGIIGWVPNVIWLGTERYLFSISGDISRVCLSPNFGVALCCHRIYVWGALPVIGYDALAQKKVHAMLEEWCNPTAVGFVIFHRPTPLDLEREIKDIAALQTNEIACLDSQGQIFGFTSLSIELREGKQPIRPLATRGHMDIPAPLYDKVTFTRDAWTRFKLIPDLYQFRLEKSPHGTHTGLTHLEATGFRPYSSCLLALSSTGQAR